MDSQSARALESDPRNRGKQKRAIFGLSWRLAIMAVVCAVILGFILYMHYDYVPNKLREAFSAPQPPAVVSESVATKLTVPNYLQGIGTLQAVHQVTVSPEVAGRVTQIMFEPGATVQAGDPLIQLFDKPDRGDLATYEAQAKLATLNLNRARALIRREFETQVNVDLQQSNLDIANANIAKTQAVISQKLVRAPFSGQLGLRQVDLGQYLTAGAPVVTLTDLDTLWVNFTLPEQTRSKLAIGQDVNVSADAYPSRAFKAKVTSIELQVSADTRNIKVQATLDNPEHLLLPGMFANAQVVLAPTPDVLTLPETAVDYSLYGDAVYLIQEGEKDKDGKPTLTVTRTFVKTGQRQDGKVAILEGLRAGDRVASSGQIKLYSGGRVVVNTEDSLAPPAKTPNN
jgi:multidrug efflux system membrane fusion protein